MGACVSTHQKPSAMKVQVLFGANDINLVKPPLINDDPPPAKPQWTTSESAPIFRNFGSKEETFFDSQAWLESDCDDDFMSVNGEFTPSRGNTPVHHNFSTGNNKPPVVPYQPSPNSPEKKMRLSDLFNESQRGGIDDSDDEEDARPANKTGVNPKAESPLGEPKTKRERFGKGCFPSLLSSRSSSMNGRKMMSPGPSPSPRPNAVVG